RLGRIMIFWGACCLLPLILIPFSWGWDPGSIPIGLDFSLRFINGWGFFFLIPFLVRDKRDFNLFIYAWLASTVIPALFGLYYLLTGNPNGFQITAGWWRIAGPYHDAAAFMTEISPALPIMLYLASGVGKWWKRALWLIPICAWFILVFNAYTRSFWFATSIVLLLWIFTRLWEPSVVAAAGAVYKWPLIWKRLTTAGIEEVESAYAVGGRVGLWKDFWVAFKQSSILDKILGRWAGIKGFGSILDFHNQYILTTANMGIIGLLANILLLMGFLHHLIKDMFVRPAWRRECLLGLSVLVMAVVLSFSGKFLIVPNNQWFLFGFMGLIINWDIKRNEP
ncbi:MAG: O-antigen ligase family protein, partial [Candidatus Hydrothermia bacterium]